MPRVSRKQADANRAEVVAAAARLFRAHGINGVSVPVLMAEAGLTHGAFYGQFASKDQLAGEACKQAFMDKKPYYDDLRERHGSDQEAARAEYVKRYLSRSHRDHPSSGCPVAALGPDAGREEFKGAVRQSFAWGLGRMVE